MPNVIFPKYKQAVLQGDGSLSGANIKSVLVDLADYTYSNAHEFLSDVPAAARVATSANLSGISLTNGVFDTANFSFSAVTGDVSEALIVFIDSGTPSTSRLIAFYDTGVAGLPITPNGKNIDVVVNASGWFSL